MGQQGYITMIKMAEIYWCVLYAKHYSKPITCTHAFKPVFNPNHNPMGIKPPNSHHYSHPVGEVYEA